MAKILETLGTINVTSFNTGRAIFKADRNATGVFKIKLLDLGGYITSTKRESNKVALTLETPDGDITYRLDFNERWEEGSTLRYRYSGGVLQDIVRMVGVIQDPEKGPEYVKKLDMASTAAATKEDRDLFAHILPDKQVKVTIIQGAAKNDDGLYPLQLEWA